MLDMPDARGTPGPDVFPKRALAGVALALFANAFALTNLFPYVGYQCVWLGVAEDKDESGFYAGFLAAGFMIGRALTAVPWGVLSDRKGRRPVLIVCCVTMGVFQLMFGLSRTFGTALVSRTLLGLFNGLVGTAKTVASELVPAERADLQAKSASYMMLGVSLAFLLGPAVGGYLAEPATTIGGGLDTALMRRYPYLLPNIVGFVLSLLAAVAVFAWVPETVGRQCSLQPPDDAVDSEHDDDGGVLAPADVTLEVEVEMTALALRDDDDQEGDDGAPQLSFREQHRHPGAAGRRRRREPAPLEQPLSPAATGGGGGGGGGGDGGGSDGGGSGMAATCRLLRNRHIRLAVLVYAAHSFCSIFIGEMYPLWCIASTDRGGLAWTIAEVGTSVSVTGIMLLPYQLWLYPRLAKRTPPIRLMFLTMAALIPTCVFFPFIGFFSLARGASIALTTVVRGTLSLLSTTVFTSSFLLINNSCLSKQRGAVNGLAMFVASFTKAMGPIVGAELFAWSINGGSTVHLPFFVDAALWALLVLVVLRLPTSLNVMVKKQQASASKRAVIVDAPNPNAGDEAAVRIEPPCSAALAAAKT